jgi:hypothetical protein
MKRVSASHLKCATATLVLAAFCLSGCATELTFRRREALDSLIGQDRSAIEQRLGQPTKITSQSGVELLTYDDHELKWMQGEPGTRNGDNFPIGPWVDKTQCSTTFRLTDGHVDAWRLDGNDCRNPNFPPLGSGDSHALAEAAVHGVNQVADYPHNSFTGRSIVNYGEFQTQ